jgi:hypothetical protein
VDLDLAAIVGVDELLEDRRGEAGEGQQGSWRRHP